MIKNQHLLIAIAVLGFGSAVACMLLMVSERSNSTALTKLTGELQDARRDLQAKTDVQVGETNDKLTELAKKHADLAKQHLALEGKHANLQGQYESLRSGLITAEQVLKANKSFLDSLKQKKWLANSGNVEPWEAHFNNHEMQISDHKAKLKTLEERLKKLTDPPK